MEMPETFVQSVREAYEHLYDLVYLRSHPLANALVPNAMKARERAWQLHHLLIDAIEELDPGPKAPPFSREWRRHRLMVLRYVEGLDVQDVSDQLAISRRHYYREHDEAIEAIAQVLWERYAENRPTQQVEEIEETSRTELLQKEIARLSQQDGYAEIDQVLDGVLSILQEPLLGRHLELDRIFPNYLPRLAVPYSLLRQLLLSALGYLIDHSREARIQIHAQVRAGSLKLTASVSPPSALEQTSEEVQRQLVALEELATIAGIRFEDVSSQTPSSITMWLPVETSAPILVVDDNEDTVELIRRYLTLHQYPVIGATSALEAFDLAKKVSPKAVILDLMMPGRDGWDLLQMIRHHPTTQAIPVIVCTVLHQKELALALGATAFLEKPITEQGLLEALQGIDRG